MRIIDAIGLKQALAVSAILDDNKTIEQIIDEQPTIEPEQTDGFTKWAKSVADSYRPERKKGEWILDPGFYSARGLSIFYMCTVCKKQVKGEKTNYCPNCGADMRGGADEIN